MASCAVEVSLLSLFLSTEGAHVLSLLDLESLGRLSCASRDFSLLPAIVGDVRWSKALQAIHADLTHVALPPAAGPGRPASENVRRAVAAARAAALARHRISEADLRGYEVVRPGEGLDFTQANNRWEVIR